MSLFSNAILKGVSDDTVPTSLCNPPVPSSNKNLPPIADTIPSAASIPDPPENLTLSPTAYCLPAV